MSRKNTSLHKICALLGGLLLAVAVVLFVIGQVSVRVNQRNAADYAARLLEIVSEQSSAVPEERIDHTMPVLSVDGNDFVALLEVPVFDAVFPVGAEWGSSNAYPCRYDGSVYADTLIIGSTNQIGQFDFVKEILVGDAIYLTDMLGNRYSFEVADIQYREHADNDTLYAEDNALTVFVKNMNAFEYIMIRCELK